MIGWRRASLWCALLWVAACGPADSVTELRVWGIGREGEVLRELVPAFEREHPGVRVRVQQIPWSAAHEKLLTAHVGDVLPDVAQMGNSWLPEFAALHALQPLDALLAESTTLRRELFFDGVWATNVIDQRVVGVPWYVDTRLLFYRRDLLTAAGWPQPPRTWSEWRRAMEAVRQTSAGTRYGAFLPVNEFEHPVVLGLQAGAPMVDVQRNRGAFRDSTFRKAFAFYTGLFRDSLIPALGNNEIGNLYQEFARGRFVFLVTGPWNLGEMARRLPDSLQSAWATAPMPAPDSSGVGHSTAGGSSLVVFRHSRHQKLAWQFVEYLSRPSVQLDFYRLTGDLPARTDAWRDGQLDREPRLRAFFEQLRHVRAVPLVPEWETIASRLIDQTERVVRGGVSIDSALAALDRDVDRLLEKRRWLAEQVAR
jgi:multiple sugar transport system substrate-binding protein